MLATAQDILNLARAQLGVAENPLGSNSGTPYHAWYGIQKAQWCAIFVSWLYAMIDVSLVHGLKSYYSGDFIKTGTTHGEMVLYPQPGCIAVMDYNRDNFTDHIGVVYRVVGGMMYLYEGNHNDRVESVPRSLSGTTKYYFIMPKYKTSSLKPKSKENEMATNTSGVPVTSWGGIYQVGIMDGRPWDVWVKAQNPTADELEVTVTCTMNDANPSKTYPVGANQILEVQCGKDLGAHGNALVRIESKSVPMVMTLDHRPSK